MNAQQTNIENGDGDFTPALGYKFLTPLYDLSIGLLTRERTWRGKLIELVDPLPNDRILDVGCGTGSLALQIGACSPKSEIIGLDPDPSVLDRARRKRKVPGANITWMQGFLDERTAGTIGSASKVVSTLVLHQTPLEEKTRILAAMREVLAPGGALWIADYGLQRTKLMRTLFRTTVQILDGVHDTQPNADGCIPDLMESVGFRSVKEYDVLPTCTGSISIYGAVH